MFNFKIDLDFIEIDENHYVWIQMIYCIAKYNLLHVSFHYGTYSLIF